MEAQIDGTDREIVELLLAAGRRTLADIGSAVGLSAPAVKRRLARLEELEVILGYTARVDHAKLGEPIEAFTELRFAGDTEVSAIARVADGVREVDTIYTIAGDPDALVHLRVRDLAGLTRAIDKLRRSGRVTGTKTLMVLDTHEPRGATDNGDMKGAARDDE